MDGRSRDIKSMSLQELTEEMSALGEKPYRARQLYAWMHQKLAGGYDEMTDLPKALRERLPQAYDYTTLSILRTQTAQDGTSKHLLALPDGETVEAVWMRYHHGVSVCISSQVGCAMGCAFCASTIGGVVRSLTAAEMLEQVYALTRSQGERVSNVVVMGIGEPLENYDALVRFLRMLTGPEGLHVSQRGVTVSTCGIVPAIHRLSEEGLSVTLAISLHAVTDEKRASLMPVARRYAIEEVLDAGDAYFGRTGRRVSYEYALIEGKNDTKEDAHMLASLARQHGAHINLIPLNPVTERGLRSPGAQRVQGFADILTARGANVTVRRSLGGDIDGACGQLRRRAGSG